MQTAIILGITFVVILILSRLYKFFSPQIKFYTTGLDSKFSISEINSLWKLSQMCDLEEPQSLYWSVPSLSRCITHLIEESQQKGTSDTPEVQNFLSKLYKYRTKIEIETDRKRGLDSTKDLDRGQKLRIILPGKGLFESEIINCGRDLVIKVPTQKGIIKVKGEEWENQDISVYLWRKGDANYVFDSRVLGSGVFNGQSALYITHSDTMLRAQKRRSVRCECHVPAQLYFLNQEIVNYSAIETGGGYRCVLEDISEDGAMIRIGGKGNANIKIKLQFTLDDSLIVMFGIIRAVEFNSEINQSRLHFECTHVEPIMKNNILSFVYKVLPQKEKEIFEALTETEKDEAADGHIDENEFPVSKVGENGLIDNGPAVINPEESFANVDQDTPITIDFPIEDNSL